MMTLKVRNLVIHFAVLVLIAVTLAVLNAPRPSLADTCAPPRAFNDCFYRVDPGRALVDVADGVWGGRPASRP